MPRYDKLVRDRITDLMDERGVRYTARTLTDDDYADALYAKLTEEVAEFEDASGTDHRLAELADILEVIHALARQEGATPEDVEARRAEKERQVGRFDRHVFLIETD